MEDFFGEQPPLLSSKGNFDHHVAVVTLPAGAGEYPTLSIQCLGVGKPGCSCVPQRCELQELYSEVGWDCIQAAGDIELARLSIRADWSDPEVPWLDVEP